MTWLRETISDGKTGRASSKRVVMLMAGTSFALSVVILSLAACFGMEVAAAISAVAVPLAGLAGYGYVNGKLAERQPEREQ